MEVERVSDGLRATDRADYSVLVGTSGWEPKSVTSALADPSSIKSVAAELEATRKPDGSVAGVVRSLSVPAVVASVLRVDVDGGERVDPRLTDGDSHTVEYPALLLWRTPVGVVVRFDGPATLTQTDDGTRHVLEFPASTPVQIGFVSHAATAEAGLSAPPTPTGLAAVIERLADPDGRYTPNRSWPTLRSAQPTPTFSPDASVPDGPVPETDVTLVVPPDPAYLVPAAPLCYYTGASVSLDPDVTPQLRLGERTKQFDTIGFDRQVTRLLQRAVYLDCVVRGAGPHGYETTARTVVDRLGLDDERLYDTPMGERVGAYLDVSFESVRDRFPDWPFVIHAEPTVGALRVVAGRIDSLPAVRLPRFDRTRTLDPTATRPTATTESAYRGYDATDEPNSDEAVSTDAEASDNSSAVSTDAGTSASFDASVARRMASAGESATVVGETQDGTPLVVPPNSETGLHGWLAPGVPVDGFEAVPVAHDHHRESLGDPSPVPIVAVVNDGATRTEHEAVATHYRDRAQAMNLSPSVRTNLTTAELAQLFESAVGLVHFVGHRDERGLQCADGFLDVASIDTVGVEAFFLNACGSYPEGKRLIEKGSIAGGVTVERVLDEEAATVGVSFARLILQGYSVARALSVASAPVLSARDYVVVGDGAYRLASEGLGQAARRRLVETDDGFRVVMQGGKPSLTGSVVEPGFNLDDAKPHLLGTRRVLDLSRERFLNELPSLEYPLFYQGDLWWPDELHAELTDT